MSYFLQSYLALKKKKKSYLQRKTCYFTFIICRFNLSRKISKEEGDYTKYEIVGI